MLDMCDGIYLLKGWEKSCGSNRELGYAMAKGKIILRQYGVDDVSCGWIKLHRKLQDCWIWQEKEPFDKRNT